MAVFHYEYKAFLFWTTTCSHQPLRNLPVVIALPPDHLLFSSKHFYFFSFEKLTRQLISNLHCNYVWLQAFVASRRVRLWVLLFSQKLCPTIIVIWWWHPSVGQVVNMESYVLLWMLNLSDFLLQCKSKPFIHKLEKCSHWNNNMFIAHRKFLDVDVTLHIDVSLCMPVLKQNVL